MTDYEEVQALITAEVLKELERARGLHPCYPQDVIHQAAIVGEEAGEVLKAAIDRTYHAGTEADLIMELIQTGAMVRRMLTPLIIKRERERPDTVPGSDPERSSEVTGAFQQSDGGVTKLSQPRKNFPEGDDA